MILRRAFDIVELLAISGSYTDEPQHPAGSTILNQILRPVRIPLVKGSAPGTFTTAVGIAKHGIGELLAAVDGPRREAPRWTLLRVLQVAGTLRVDERPDNRLDLAAPGLRDLILTPLVGFPLAIYPFFDDPFDPLGHLARYAADYFPEIERADGGTRQGRWLILQAAESRLRLWTDHVRLYADYFDRRSGESALMALFANAAIFGLRVVDGEAPSTVTEDLTGISCRNVGAVKRTWAAAPGRRARAITSNPRLLEVAALIDAARGLPQEITGAAALLTAAEGTARGGATA